MSGLRDGCCGGGVPTLIFGCSGSSNVGQLTNGLALRLVQHGVFHCAPRRRPVSSLERGRRELAGRVNEGRKRVGEGVTAGVTLPTTRKKEAPKPGSFGAHGLAGFRGLEGFEGGRRNQARRRRS